MGNCPSDFLNQVGQYPTMQTWRERLESRMNELNFSMKSLSHEAGLGETTVRDILKRGRSPSIEVFSDIAKLLGVSVAWLLGEDHQAISHIGNTSDLPTISLLPPEYVAVQFLEAKAGMGAGQIPDEAWGYPRYFEAGLIASLRAQPDDLGAMELDGQSMEPILYSGDQILFNRKKVNVAEPGIFVLWDGDGIVCKWVERVHGSDPTMLRIFSENKRFKEYSVLAEQAVIHGRVVWFARRF